VHVVPPYGQEFATSSDSKTPGFTVHLAYVADLFFSTLESGFKNIRIRCRIHRMSVDGRRIRKEKVTDTEICGYVLTGPTKTKTDGNRNVCYKSLCISKGRFTLGGIVPDS